MKGYDNLSLEEVKTRLSKDEYYKVDEVFSQQEEKQLYNYEKEGIANQNHDIIQKKKAELIEKYLNEKNVEKEGLEYLIYENIDN